MFVLPQRTQRKHKGRKDRLIVFFLKNLCVLCGWRHTDAQLFPVSIWYGKV